LPKFIHFNICSMFLNPLSGQRMSISFIALCKSWTSLSSLDANAASTEHPRFVHLSSLNWYLFSWTIEHEKKSVRVRISTVVRYCVIPLFLTTGGRISREMIEFSSYIGTCGTEWSGGVRCRAPWLNDSPHRAFPRMTTENPRRKKLGTTQGRTEGQDKT
jgi:hypothetical protein